nr:chemotaxis protein CheW [Bacillota bacterium]
MSNPRPSPEIKRRAKAGETEEHFEQLVTFFLGEGCFAFPLRVVLEIIRKPQTVRVPLAPPSLVGLANLRGAVLPIFDLRRILHLPQRDYDDATRVLVIQNQCQLGMVVDQVSRVLAVRNEEIEEVSQIDLTVDARFLRGVAKVGPRGDLVQVLDAGKLLEREYDTISMNKEDRIEELQASTRSPELSGPEIENETTTQLVTFCVAAEEYGLAVSEVEEVVRLPDRISDVPGAQREVLGLINLRGRLLPLVSLRRIYEFPDKELDDQSRAVVLRKTMPGGRIARLGLLVDHVREVLNVSENDMQPVPPLLLGVGKSGQIEAICRLEEGRRLISVIRGERFFQRKEVNQVLHEGAGDETTSEGNEEEKMSGNEVQLVIFQLGNEEFGIPVEYVQEIIRVPEKMSVVPRAPRFVEGLVNLRGAVLPVLDMRARFGLERLERNENQRIIVLNTSGTIAGFVVDSVIEVLRVPSGELEPSPALSDEQVKLVGQIVNLSQEDRMIQIVEAEKLLSDEELAVLRESQQDVLVST